MHNIKFKTETVESHVEVHRFECDFCEKTGGHVVRHPTHIQDGGGHHRYVTAWQTRDDEWGDQHIGYCYSCERSCCRECAIDTSYSVEEGIEMNTYGGFYCRECLPDGKPGSGQEIEKKDGATT